MKNLPVEMDCMNAITLDFIRANKPACQVRNSRHASLLNSDFLAGTDGR
jgi:hypothetical protein